METRRSLLKWLLIVSVLTVGGCAYVTTAVDRAKGASDAGAKVKVQLPCAMTVGGFYRALSDRQRLGVYLLCNPDAELPTIEEIEGAKGE